MALDIFEIKLNKRQEKKVLEIASKQGHFSVYLNKEDKLRISSEKEKPKKGETHAVTVDASNHYYEWLLGWLGQQGIVPSEELMGEIEGLVIAEKAVEDQELSRSIETLDSVTADARERLRKRLDEEMRSEITAKQKNDFRCVIKRLDARDYKADYIAMWTTRTFGQEEGLAYVASINGVEDRFGSSVIRSRVYGRIFLDEAKPIKAGKSLKWIRLSQP